MRGALLLILLSLPLASALPLTCGGAEGTAYVGPSPDFRAAPAPCGVRVVPLASGRACAAVDAAKGPVHLYVSDDSQMDVQARYAFFDAAGHLLGSRTVCATSLRGDEVIGPGSGLAVPAGATSIVVDVGFTTALLACGAATEGSIVLTQEEPVAACTDIL